MVSHESLSHVLRVTRVTQAVATRVMLYHKYNVNGEFTLVVEWVLLKVKSPFEIVLKTKNYQSTKQKFFVRVN